MFHACTVFCVHCERFWVICTSHCSDSAIIIGDAMAMVLIGFCGVVDLHPCGFPGASPFIKLLIIIFFIMVVWCIVVIINILQCALFLMVICWYSWLINASLVPRSLSSLGEGPSVLLLIVWSDSWLGYPSSLTYTLSS